MNQSNSEIHLCPLLHETLELGQNTVNFDDSMRRFVALTGVEFETIRQAAASVEQTVRRLGLGSNQAIHAYLRFTDEPSQHTFLTGTIEETEMGHIRMNTLISGYKVAIERHRQIQKDGLKKMRLAGIRPGIATSHLLQFGVVDQVLHEFAHAFGVTPKAIGLEDVPLNDIERITDAIAIAAIPATHPSANRELIFTGFTRLLHSVDRSMFGEPIKTLCQDILSQYHLIS